MLTSCGKNHEAPKWLLIEYPNKEYLAVMQFPGVKMESFEEYQRQDTMVLERRFGSAGDYHGKLMCGSNYRFSIDWGTPLCDELVYVE